MHNRPPPCVSIVYGPDMPTSSSVTDHEKPAIPKLDAEPATYLPMTPNTATVTAASQGNPPLPSSWERG